MAQAASASAKATGTSPLCFLLSAQATEIAPMAASAAALARVIPRGSGPIALSSASHVLHMASVTLRLATASAMLGMRGHHVALRALKALGYHAVGNCVVRALRATQATAPARVARGTLA